MQRGKLILLYLKERELLFRACFALLSKVVVFCGTFGCIGKGYIERETSLASVEREGVVFRACFAHLSKVVVFCGTFGCIGKGYVERETSLALLKREGVAFQGSLCSPLKSGGFLWHFWVHRLKVVKVW